MQGNDGRGDVEAERKRKRVVGLTSEEAKMR
jgi:hypothetical protein